MNHAFLAGSNLHERAEVHQSGDNALEDLAGLGILGDDLDNAVSLLALLDVNTADENLAVIVDVDLDLAVSGNLLNDLAAAADNLPDLVHRNGEGEHLGSVLAQLLARFGNRLEHDLIENEDACLVGFYKSVPNHFRRKTVDLQIHLNGGDAFVGTAHLEVHIAEEVLQTLNVNHCHPAVALGDQTAGNTGDGSLDRNAGVHQSQCGTADGAL